MPAKNELMGKDVVTKTTTAASNTDSVVTVTAPTNSGVATLYIAGIILSANGTISTGGGVAPTLTGVVGGTLTFQIPPAGIAPIVMLFGVHPLKITAGVNAVLTLPALGTNIVGTATLLYYVGAV